MQGKMEKSFLSFTALYHNWEPEASGRAVLANVRDFQPDPSSGASQLIESQLWGSVLPHLNPAFGPYEPITLPAAAATTTLSPSSQAASGASLHLETSGGALASSGLVAAKVRLPNPPRRCCRSLAAASPSTSEPGCARLPLLPTTPPSTP